MILHWRRRFGCVVNMFYFSFPGGKVEESDGTLVRTAVRECCEELNISESDIDVWGQYLRMVKYVLPRYMTIPVIANLGDIEDLTDLKHIKPSQEVDSILIGSRLV